MHVSDKAITLISHFEGLIPYAYEDPVGHCTFGVGHLIHPGRCTEADYRKFGSKHAQRPHAVDRARRILREDLEGVELRVSQLVRRGTTRNQFDAMCSLAFNIGVGSFANSSVLRLHNAKRPVAAGAAFMLWIKAGRPLREVPGLIRRRRAERRLYRGKRVILR